MAESTQPAQRMMVGNFIVSNDVERSRRFYTEVLGTGHGHPGGVCRMERPGRPVPDAAEAARVRNPLLHPGSRRVHH